MSSHFEHKQGELLIEFTQYLLDHPEEKIIPTGVEIVLLDRNDPEFSRQAIEASQRPRPPDDRPPRPIVYVEITEMAPIRSRVRHLEIHERPPEYTIQPARPAPASNARSAVKRNGRKSGARKSPTAKRKTRTKVK